MAPLAAASAHPCVLVALTVVSGVFSGAPAWGCLLCFTTYRERLRICQIFMGVQGRKVEKCEEDFSDAFKGLLDSQINYDERSHLHDSFTQMTLTLEELANAKGSHLVAFSYAAQKMQEAIARLKKVPACVPPCGHQELSRRFLCRGCYSKVCDLPLDCPIQDVTVRRGDQAMFSCSVNFPLPKEEISYSWKYAEGGMRTQDSSYFRDMPRAHGYLARIRPVQPTHSGTFSCVISHEELPLARLFFFLNVTGPPPRAETELQVTFREVLRWTPREAEGVEPWTPSLGELLAEPGALTSGNLFLLAAAAALAAAGATLLAWAFFLWYFRGN